MFLVLTSTIIYLFYSNTFLKQFAEYKKSQFKRLHS